MAAVLVVLLVVVPIAEIYVLIRVGQVLGAVPTVILLIGLSVLGGVLLRREGTRAWRAVGDAVRAGRVPTAEVADGALVLAGGALLLTPGFLTDAVGLLCVLPGSRTAVRRLLTATVVRRLGLAGLAGAYAVRRVRRPGRSAGTVVDGAVVDGTVVDSAVVDSTVVDSTVVDGADGGPTVAEGSRPRSSRPADVRRSSSPRDRPSGPP